MTQIEQYANLRRFTDENGSRRILLISCPRAFQDVASPSTETYVDGDRVAPLAQSDSLFLSVDRRLLMM
jgi:hypothetical protein